MSQKKTSRTKDTTNSSSDRSTTTNNDDSCSIPVPPPPPPAHRRDYTHSYWKNCWRRYPGSKIRDILCFETGYYGFSLDVGNLSKGQYKVWNDDDDDDQQKDSPPTYTSVMKSQRMITDLEEINICIQIIINDDDDDKTKTYQATTARPVNPKNNPGLCHGRLWEAGRIAQHYELVGIVFQNVDDNNNDDDVLPCSKASLSIVAWPEEFAMTLSLKPDENATVWQKQKKSVEVHLELQTTTTTTTDETILWTTTQQYLHDSNNKEEEKKVTLTCHYRHDHHHAAAAAVSSSSNSSSSANPQENKKDKQITIKVSNQAAPNQLFPVTYEDYFSCFVVDIQQPQRNFPRGYTDIRNADIFCVEITNNTTTTNDDEDETSSSMDYYVPILFHLMPAANITGLVPMIWIPNQENDSSSYIPSGIPIQTSKNWHYKPMGEYLRAYTLLPVSRRRRRTAAAAAATTLSSLFEFRVYYGFYGPLCSASHANLSLVGWPEYSNVQVAGRWEQLAIGCFGETYCLDMEMSATTQTITDVRALLVQSSSATKKKWGWTNAGWGGDWLSIMDQWGRKQYLGGVKVAYLSQGPCLTEVKYNGYYFGGAYIPLSQQIGLDATVYTMRTNDYARTIQKITYNFSTKVAFTNRSNKNKTLLCCLYRMGSGGDWEGWYCRRVAFGNSEGLLQDIELTDDTVKVGSFLLRRHRMTGPGPWWIAFPDSGFRQPQGDKGIAWKCLVIRSYESTIGGTYSCCPNVSFYVRKKIGPGQYTIDALLTPQRNVTELNAGDTISFTVEWVTFPYSADDYYGDNQALREHLVEHPKSWQTALREAAGNNLHVGNCSDGAIVRSTYPLIIQKKRTTSSGIKVSIRGGIGAVPIRFEGLESRNYRLFNNNDDDESCCEEWYETCYDPADGTYSMTFNLLLDDKQPQSFWKLVKK